METPVKIGFAVAMLIAFAISVKVLRDRLPEGQGTVKIVARLDEHTIKEGPEVKNAIPSFLELPGEVGILPDSVVPPAEAAAAAPAAVSTTPASGAAAPPAQTSPATPVTPEPGTPTSPEAAPPPPASDALASQILPSDVKPIAESELQKGFCTVSLTALVRQRYPGTYDSIPDSELENGVLKQHPEYKGRLCVFPAWITASPHTIIKYEIERAVIAMPPSIWIWSGGFAAVFGVLLLLAYKKFIDVPPVKKPAAKPARSSTRPRDRA